MGLLSFLTGGSETAGKVVDGVKSGLDMAFYTDEEKAIASKKMLDWKLDWLKATKPQNVARRVIAFGVTGLWVVNVLLLTLLTLFDSSRAEPVKAIIEDIVNLPFMIIIGFYFAAHVARVVKK